MLHCLIRSCSCFLFLFPCNYVISVVMVFEFWFLSSCMVAFFICMIHMYEPIQLRGFWIIQFEKDYSKFGYVILYVSKFLLLFFVFHECILVTKEKRLVKSFVYHVLLPSWDFFIKYCTPSIFQPNFSSLDLLGYFVVAVRFVCFSCFICLLQPFDWQSYSQAFL